MAEGVIDVLEIVEIEEVCRYLFTAFGPVKRLFELLIEEGAVGQAGKSVVMRHVGDLGLGAALVGDVLMRRHCSTVGHGPNRNGEAASVAELAVEMAEGVVAAAQHAAHDVVGRHFRLQAVGHPMLDNLLQRGAGLHLRRGKVVDFGISVVAQHEPMLGIEHRQALDDVVECCIELVILRPQLFLFELEQFVLLLELFVEPLQLGFPIVEFGQRGRPLGGCNASFAVDVLLVKDFVPTMRGRRAADRVGNAAMRSIGRD